MLHPAVEAETVEHVSAVAEPADLVVAFEFVEADGAAVGDGVREMLEFDDGEGFLDELGGDGLGRG